MILTASTVHTCFDNDEAGRRATTQVEHLAPAVKEVDQSHFYRDYNDWKDYLRSRQPVKGKK